MKGSRHNKLCRLSFIFFENYRIGVNRFYRGIAFGDNLNDIEMLKYVGHGVAMGECPRQSKACCKIHYKRCKQ